LSVKLHRGHSRKRRGKSEGKISKSYGTPGHERRKIRVESKNYMDHEKKATKLAFKKPTDSGEGVSLSNMPSDK